MRTRGNCQSTSPRLNSSSLQTSVRNMQSAQRRVHLPSKLDRFHTREACHTKVKRSSEAPCFPSGTRPVQGGFERVWFELHSLATSASLFVTSSSARPEPCRACARAGITL